MNVSCLFFNNDGEVCFAEVVVVPTLAEALLQCHERLKAQHSFAWFELWQNGKCVASSHDGDCKPVTGAKARGILH